MSAADTRRDTGDFYPGGKRVVTTPVAMGGDVKHSDFADVTVETNSIPKMRQAIETLAQKLGATVAAIAIAVASIGAGFDSVPVNEIDFDENPSVVTNVTFDGLLQAETDPSWAARSNAVMQAVWSLGSLACLDALGWSDITNKPSWIGATKPTYSLNEICPDSENWLGVQGNAGRHIKVLAGTAGGQIVGGLRVTASTQNDNNMTTYTYGGVAVRRNGTNTDYVFDTSSQSGIVRRSELASLAPATNIARSALAQDVQASLDKADSALQTAPVSSVNSKTGAVTLTASDVGAVPTTGGTMNGGLTVPNLTVGSRKDGSTVGNGSVAEGLYNTASASYAHAEGGNAVASGTASHAEGGNTTASGTASHAEGYFTKAVGVCTHAEGADTIATNGYEHAQGRSNASHKASNTFGDAGNTLSSIGFSDDPQNRKNAVETMQDGKTFIYGLGGYNGTNPTGAGVQDLATAINNKAPLASPAFTGTPTAPTPASGDNSTKVATTAFVQEAISGTWSATNTVAVIARHTGKETVSIPSGGNLVADLSGWNDGVQTFVVLQPSGVYTVASNVKYCGYGTWPTNTALCVAWPYAGKLYVNPITIIRE